MLNHDRRRLNNTAVRRNVGGNSNGGGGSGDQDNPGPHRQGSGNILHRRNVKSDGSLLDPKAPTSGGSQMFAKPKSGQPASAYASIQGDFLEMLDLGAEIPNLERKCTKMFKFRHKTKSLNKLLVIFSYFQDIFAKPPFTTFQFKKRLRRFERSTTKQTTLKQQFLVFPTQ